jgi:hypothetical protein
MRTADCGLPIADCGWSNADCGLAIELRIADWRAQSAFGSSQQFNPNLQFTPQSIIPSPIRNRHWTSRNLQSAVDIPQST